MIYNWQFPSVHDNKLWNGTFYRNIKLFKLGTCGNDILYLITKYSHARVITSMQNFRHFVLYFHSRFWYSILPSSELFHDSKWFTLRKRHCGWLNKERQLQIAYILQTDHRGPYGSQQFPAGVLFINLVTDQYSDNMFL